MKQAAQRILLAGSALAGLLALAWLGAHLFTGQNGVRFTSLARPTIPVAMRPLLKNDHAGVDFPDRSGHRSWLA